jgi:hypothetical protein
MKSPLGELKELHIAGPDARYFGEVILIIIRIYNEIVTYLLVDR